MGNDGTATAPGRPLLAAYQRPGAWLCLGKLAESTRGSRP